MRWQMTEDVQGMEDEELNECGRCMCPKLLLTARLAVKEGHNWTAVEAGAVVK